MPSIDVHVYGAVDPVTVVTLHLQKQINRFPHLYTTARPLAGSITRPVDARMALFIFVGAYDGSAFSFSARACLLECDRRDAFSVLLFPAFFFSFFFLFSEG